MRVLYLSQELPVPFWEAIWGVRVVHVVLYELLTFLRSILQTSSNGEFWKSPEKGFQPARSDAFEFGVFFSSYALNIFLAKKMLHSVVQVVVVEGL